MSPAKEETSHKICTRRVCRANISVANPPERGEGPHDRDMVAFLVSTHGRAGSVRVDRDQRVAVGRGFLAKQTHQLPKNG